jgi:serine/threonine protein kinase/tetratricopeptide (TPR) repeat protein
MSSDRTLTTASGHRFPELPGYQLIAKIGQGGMGVVYKARQTLLGRVVAIKALHLDFLDDESSSPPPDSVDSAETARERFVREGTALAQMSHDGIVRVYDLIRDNHGNGYLVMEFIEGRSLEAMIDAGEKISPARAALIGADSADALHHAHERGVIHRDVKAANIMIAADGKVKIMDFGVARMENASRMTKTGFAMGTIYYMSPEQLVGDRNLDARSDVYSLAVALYHALAGRLPFEETNPIALADSIRFAPPPPPSLANPAICQELEEVVLQGLEKRPEDRYPHAAAFAAALREAARAQERPASGLSGPASAASRSNAPIPVGAGFAPRNLGGEGKSRETLPPPSYANQRAGDLFQELAGSSSDAAAEPRRPGAPDEKIIQVRQIEIPGEEGGVDDLAGTGWDAENFEANELPAPPAAKNRSREDKSWKDKDETRALTGDRPKPGPAGAPAGPRPAPKDKKDEPRGPSGESSKPSFDEPRSRPSFDEPRSRPSFEEPRSRPSFEEPRSRPSFDEPRSRPSNANAPEPSPRPRPSPAQLYEDPADAPLGLNSSRVETTDLDAEPGLPPSEFGFDETRGLPGGEGELAPPSLRVAVSDSRSSFERAALEDPSEAAVEAALAAAINKKPDLPAFAPSGLGTPLPAPLPQAMPALAPSPPAVWKDSPPAGARISPPAELSPAFLPQPVSHSGIGRSGLLAIFFAVAAIVLLLIAVVIGVMASGGGGGEGSAATGGESGRVETPSSHSGAPPSFEKAEALFLAGNVDRAEDTLKELTDGGGESGVELARAIRSIRQAAEQIKTGRISEAEAALNEIARPEWAASPEAAKARTKIEGLRRDRAQAQYDEGQAAFRARVYDKAAALFDQAEDIHPGFRDAERLAKASRLFFELEEETIRQIWSLGRSERYEEVARLSEATLAKLNALEGADNIAKVEEYRVTLRDYTNYAVMSESYRQGDADAALAAFERISSGFSRQRNLNEQADKIEKVRSLAREMEMTKSVKAARQILDLEDKENNAFRRKANDFIAAGGGNP